MQASKETAGERRSPAASSTALPEWWQDWSDRPLVIVASGPSASDAPLGLARRHARFLAINNSWRLCMGSGGGCFADALYAADGGWWRANRHLPGFAGLKLSGDRAQASKQADLCLFCIDHADTMVFATPGEIGNGANSGFQALNVALQFGARRIALVGYDMTLAHGVHWHGSHPAGVGLSNPCPDLMVRWRAAIDSAAPDIAAIGAEVVNLSPVSALKAYPKMTMQEWLAQCAN